MKKSFKLLKAACVVGLLTVLGVTNGYAQGLRTSYFMDNVPARLKMNPALQPARGYFNIPAMLVTLCGLQLYTGLAYGITGGPAINGMCDAFKNIANGTVAGIPYVLFIYIIVVAVVAFVMRSTVFGNEIYFLGSNAKASRYSGINTLRVTIMTHMFSGILGGVSGILITSHLNSAKSSNGSTYTLLTLLIVVLGGIHPDGGKGRVTGVALATILLQMIANAFGLLHMDDNAKTFVNGCLLVAALLLDVYLDKRAAKKKAA